LPSCCASRPASIALNEHYVGHGDIVYQQACKLGCEGFVSKRLGSPYRSGRSRQWLKVKNHGGASGAAPGLGSPLDGISERTSAKRAFTLRSW
jgi:hypothetical protein